MCACRVVKPCVTNHRRVQVISDLFNPISNAAIFKTVLKPDIQNPNGVIDPCLIFNMDATSHILGGENADMQVRVTKKVLEELKVLQRDNLYH